MSFKGPLPNNILKLMAPEQRPKGAVGLTRDEAEQAGEVRHEIKDLHVPFQKWLDFHKIPYIYHRSDKKSGIRKGWPDFTVISRGKVCCVEFKRPGQKLSSDQQGCRAMLEYDETPYMMTSDVNSAIVFTKHYLDCIL